MPISPDGAPGAVRSRSTPKAGEPSLPLLFLVHGSSNSARSSYDLTVPGKGEYSFMNVFARYGYDVWTMDHDGYGYSGSSGNNSDIASSVEDLKAAIPVVAQETGQSRMHFYGTSSGAIRAAAYAQIEPARVDRLVLVAFTYKGTGAPEIGNRTRQVETYRNNNRRKRDAAMIRSIFTRDGHAASYDPAVPEAIAAMELKFGDQVPTGTYLDMAANLPLVDPKKVLSPVLMIRGIHDGNSTTQTGVSDFVVNLESSGYFKRSVDIVGTASQPLPQWPEASLTRTSFRSLSLSCDAQSWMPGAWVKSRIT